MAKRRPTPRPGINRRRAGKLLLGAIAGITAIGSNSPESLANGGLLGSIEFRAGSLDGIPAWQRVRKKLAHEAKLIAACDRDVSACGSPRIVAWRAKIHSLKGLPLTTQLRELNLFLNEIVPYLTDDENFGQEDYWTTPLEFLRHAGDCEDYAIIKFTSLLELGLTNDQMRIVVVMDTLRNLPHALLSVEAEGQVYLLDSLFDVVLTDDRALPYVPQYSVNLTDRWAHVPAKSGQSSPSQ